MASLQQMPQHHIVLNQIPNKFHEWNWDNARQTVTKI